MIAFIAPFWNVSIGDAKAMCNPSDFDHSTLQNEILVHLVYSLQTIEYSKQKQILTPR